MAALDMLRSVAGLLQTQEITRAVIVDERYYALEIGAVHVLENGLMIVQVFRSHLSNASEAMTADEWNEWYSVK